MLTVRLGLPIGRITFFSFRQRATFHTAWTQRRHSCIATNSSSLDHLVGAQQQRLRDDDADRFRGP
jgi:hypothetical protein